MTTKLTHIAGLLLLLSGLGLSPAASANAPAQNGNEASSATASVQAAAQPEQKTDARLAWQRVGSPLSMEA